MTRDPAVTSRIMAAIPNRDTGPEMLLRRELHRRGLRYRVRSQVTGRPDLVFPARRIAVFVDGDYWHGNTWRLRGAESPEEYFAGRANSAFWTEKIRANLERDSTVNQQLTAEGWQVVRVWESDIVADVAACASDIERTVRGAARTLSVPS
jgi:DNA mismatch endonuclease (patch repair protein)